MSDRPAGKAHLPTNTDAGSYVSFKEGITNLKGADVLEKEHDAAIETAQAIFLLVVDAISSLERCIAKRDSKSNELTVRQIIERENSMKSAYEVGISEFFRIATRYGLFREDYDFLGLTLLEALQALVEYKNVLDGKHGFSLRMDQLAIQKAASALLPPLGV